MCHCCIIEIYKDNTLLTVSFLARAVDSNCCDGIPGLHKDSLLLGVDNSVVEPSNREQVFDGQAPQHFDRLNDGAFEYQVHPH